MSTTIEQLTRGMPDEFEKYLNYVRSLKFDQRPDYNYCRSLFRNCMERKGFEFDIKFDWILKKNGE